MGVVQGIIVYLNTLANFQFILGGLLGWLLNWLLDWLFGCLDGHFTVGCFIAVLKPCFDKLGQIFNFFLRKVVDKAGVNWLHGLAKSLVTLVGVLYSFNLCAIFCADEVSKSLRNSFYVAHF